MGDQDHELVARMVRGDQSALGELYELHSSAVHRVVRALISDEALAADLVQDVFIEAWKRAAQYSRKRGTVRAWLVVRGRSRALDRIRSMRNKREVVLTDTGRGRAGSIEQSVDHLHLPQAFERVNDEERDVLLLGYFEGLTCAEMSDRLGVPVGTIKSRTRAAMKKLRAFWEEGS